MSVSAGDGTRLPRRSLLITGVFLSIINSIWIALLAASDLVLLESTKYPRTLAVLLGLSVIAVILWVGRQRTLSNIVSSFQVLVTAVLICVTSGIAPGNMLSIAY